MAYPASELRVENDGKCQKLADPWPSVADPRPPVADLRPPVADQRPPVADPMPPVDDPSTACIAAAQTRAITVQVNPLPSKPPI